jgi:dTMP kinase
VPSFRRLWLTLALSSIGDWLGLMATGFFAAGQVGGSTAQGAAFGGVVLVQMLPALVLGPLSGIVADRWNRRVTMVVCDVLRFLLYASIPASLTFAGAHWVVVWALVATFLTQACAMVWGPAKEAAVPNLVPGRLEQANQLSLATTYGIAPVLAALLYAVLAWGFPNRLVGAAPPQVALYFNAVTFLAAALVVVGIPGLGRPAADRPRRRQTGLLGELWSGWRYASGSRLLRGLLLGIVGAFAAGGVVIGAAPFYVTSLSGGQASFGLLFGALFVGLGVGIAVGPRLVGELSRYRWFGLSVLLAGAAVAGLAVAPHLAVAVAGSAVVGVGAGMAFLSGTTLLGGEVPDAMRGRMFAFVQTAVRVVLIFATALGALLSGIGGVHRVALAGIAFEFSLSRALLAGAGLLAAGCGYAALRLMDDRPGTPLLADLMSSVLRSDHATRPGTVGLLVLVLGEREEGNAARLHDRLGAAGYDSVLIDAGTLDVGPGHGVRDLAPQDGRAAALLRTAALAHAGAAASSEALRRGAAVVVCGLRYPLGTDPALEEVAVADGRRLLNLAIPDRPADAVLVTTGTTWTIRHWTGRRQVTAVRRELEPSRVLAGMDRLLVGVAPAAPSA